MNQEKDTMFMRLHPLVNLVYFLVMTIVTMLYLHPVLLGITGLTCFIYLCYLGGSKQVKANLKLIPFIILLSFINPLFNSSGNTVLFHLKSKPVTLEAVIYGFIAAVMIYDMILIFRIFHIIMSSDKVMAIFSKILPIGALLFTMTLRLVPMYKAQLIKMRSAQKGIGQDLSQGTRMQRIHNGVNLISGLMTWGLENALQTADSMKGRGYGLKKRTYYSNLKFTRLDLRVLCLEVIFSFGLLFGCIRGAFEMSYYPVIRWSESGIQGMLWYGMYFIFTLFPIIIDGKEEVTWRYLRQKI